MLGFSRTCVFPFNCIQLPKVTGPSSGGGDCEIEGSMSSIEKSSSTASSVVVSPPSLRRSSFIKNGLLVLFLCEQSTGQFSVVSIPLQVLSQQKGAVAVLFTNNNSDCIF